MYFAKFLIFTPWDLIFSTSLIDIASIRQAEVLIENAKLIEGR